MLAYISEHFIYFQSGWLILKNSQNNSTTVKPDSLQPFAQHILISKQEHLSQYTSVNSKNENVTLQSQLSKAP